MRLINAEGEQVGVVSISEAKQSAENSELDLVEIVPNSEPPVCRVMDYGKFIFEQNKKKHASKKKQKQIQIKEIKFRPGTEDGDYQIKLKNEDVKEDRSRSRRIWKCRAISKDGRSSNGYGFGLKKIN